MYGPVVLEMASKRSACDSASSSKVSKKTKLYCHFKSSWKAQEFSVPVGDRSGAQRTVSGDILSGVDGGDNAKCKLCGITFSVRHGGANDVVEHFSTKKHKLCLPRAVQRPCRAGGTGQAGQAKTGPLFLHVMFGINRCTVMVVND